jgi:TatD DNase family protein
MIDTHCHVDLFPNPAAIVAACEHQALHTVAVTNLPSHYRLGLEHVGGCRYVHLALGFHPLANLRNRRREMALFEEFASRARYIGEVGLDLSPEGWRTRSEQEEVIRFVFSCLRGRHCFVTLHSRRAEEQVLDLLAEYEVGPAVLHWFSGSTRALERAIGEGHYFSVNPAMAKSRRGAGLIERMPPDRVLTETDGPYVQLENRPAKPEDVRQVLDRLCAIWAVSCERAEELVQRNFERLTEGL